MRNRLLASVIAGALLSGCAESEKDVSVNNVDSANQSSSLKVGSAVSGAAAIWPKLDIEVKQNPAVEKQVSDLLSQMTLEQKIAQMSNQKFAISRLKKCVSMASVPI